jgi:hypothetical protein
MCESPPRLTRRPLNVVAVREHNSCESARPLGKPSADSGQTFRPCGEACSTLDGAKHPADRAEAQAVMADSETLTAPCSPETAAAGVACKCCGRWCDESQYLLINGVQGLAGQIPELESETRRGVFRSGWSSWPHARLAHSPRGGSSMFARRNGTPFNTEGRITAH